MREAVAAKKLFFTVTTGRSGTDYLATVAGLLPNVAASHEPTPNFVDVFRWLHASGDAELARRWWVEFKLPRIAKKKRPIYLEASHVFCKGFLEPLLELGFVPPLILLSRPHRDVAKSMYKLATIPGRTIRGDRWYLRPDDRGVLAMPGWEAMHDYQLCYWYTLEIARRQDTYEKLIAERGGTSMRIDLAELNTSEGFDRLSRFVTGAGPSMRSRFRFKRLAAQPHNTKSQAKQKRSIQLPDNLDALERAVHETVGAAAHAR